MKVNDLLQEYSSGAYHRPGFDADKGHLRGAVKDWLAKMGVEPEHLVQAVALAKKTPEFAALLKANLVYDNRPASEKLGTLVFVAKKPNWWVNSDGSYGGKPHEWRDVNYNIHANGLIRAAFPREYADGWSTTPLKSPKPRIKAGDPVGSVLMLYTASMKELLTKWEKQLAKQKKLMGA